MSVILGVNHMFLYPESMTDEKAHTETLKKLVCNDSIDALDVWVWRGKERSCEEISILRDCGKVINYNIGDRFGEKTAFPACAKSEEFTRAYDLIMREIEYGLEAGSKKFVFASGPDDTYDHKGAIERYSEFVEKVLEQVPEDCVMCLEPTDWNVDKCFLLGRLDETVDFIKKVNSYGYINFGMLLDMGHIPIMHETLDSAINKAKDVLNHIHLGNAVIKCKDDPLYGDKHPSWNYPQGEYSDDDGIYFIKRLTEMGYTARENATISFEMRPYDGMTPEESLERFAAIYRKAVNDD